MFAGSVVKSLMTCKMSCLVMISSRIELRVATENHTVLHTKAYSVRYEVAIIPCPHFNFFKNNGALGFGHVA